MSEIKEEVTPKTTRANWQATMELLKENNKAKYEMAQNLISNFEEHMKEYDETPSQSLTLIGMDLMDNIKMGLNRIDESYNTRIEDTCRVLFNEEK